MGLGAVGELAAKGRAARANGWQLVAPQANRDPDGARVPEVVRVSWAATARGADRHARQVRPLRIVLVVVAALVLASFVNARVSAGTASGGAVQAQPQAPVSTSLPPTAGLLTGPQLQALLVPVSRFPASYTFENELAGNSGPSLVDVPYLLGCDNFAQLPDLGSQDLGAAAEASATLQNTKDTNEFNQGIFQFWNHDQATAFFAKAHALLSSCFANTQDIHNTVHSTATNGLPAFTDTMTTDIGIGATLFAVQGVSVYFAGAYSPNSHLIPRTRRSLRWSFSSSPTSAHTPLGPVPPRPGRQTRAERADGQRSPRHQPASRYARHPDRRARYTRQKDMITPDA